MTRTEQAAYRDGVEMCRLGRTLDDCPYKSNYELASAWEDGYDDCLATGTMKQNLMSGKQIFVSHGTPLSCDPSSETYWSM